MPNVNDPAWRLPGVQAFIERVTDDLDAGSNVILQRPPHAPNNLVDAVRTFCVSECPHFAWKNIDAREWGHSTATLIANAIGSFESHQDVVVTNVKQLADRAIGRVYSIENIPAGCWPTFMSFLEQFRLANHRREESDRDVFLVTVDGTVDVPDFDVGLYVRRWEGIVQEIDARLYLELLGKGSGKSDLENSIAKSIAVELGGTDLGLIRYLATRLLNELVSPETLLQKYANESTWCSRDLCCWRDGGADSFRSRNRVHSSVLVLMDDSVEIKRRVWHGQLTAIFPYLEERRISLLPRVKPFLRGRELRDSQGNKVDAEDLELGSIAYFLKGTRVPATVMSEVRTLRDVRHELAHLRPVGGSLMERFLQTVNRGALQ